MFDAPPQTVEEGFITFESATISADGDTVQIGPENAGLALSAVDTPGAFSIQRFEEESKEGRTDEVVTRITFTPEHLSKDLCLRFEIG